MNSLPHRLILLALVVACIGSVARCQDISEQDAAKSAGDALQSRRFPWYDSSKDQLKQTPLTPKVQPSVSRDWTYTQQATGPINLDWLWELFQILIWVLLGGLFAFLLFHAIKSLTGLNQPTSKFDFDEDHRTEADRIENLPFQVKKRTGDLLEDARRLYEAGNYADAIVYFFSYQLVQLDKAHLIRLTKGKTNRQYLSELGTKLRLREILSQSTIVFEDVFFGHYPLDKSRFETCWNRLDEFQHELTTQRDALYAAEAVGAAL